ncbi:hypothetical protein [Thermococcus barophilus]|uniref:Uncharacterized protein n=1 Tax=Thermococcus barophilus TaxID=55802 RepID=A0A0S1XFB4_THEBA|nr:hypothetical protein [Thermococcus barophilus]ALM76489.1 hypothetical protein TBCH5v1_2600 [Thermococcus barophilus]
MTDITTIIITSLASAGIGGLITYYFTTHSKIYEISEKVGENKKAIENLQKDIKRLENAINEKFEDAAYGITNLLKILLEKAVISARDILKAFGLEYLTRYKGKLTNPNPTKEEKLRTLLEKAEKGTITKEEAEELQKLLEEQKKKHEKEGDIEGLIMVLALLLALAYILKALTEKK